jgi:thioesterase domain-containing protein
MSVYLNNLIIQIYQIQIFAFSAQQEIQIQNPVEKYITQLTRVSVFGKFELLNYLGNKGGVR